MHTPDSDPASTRSRFLREAGVRTCTDANGRMPGLRWAGSLHHTRSGILT